MNLGQATLGSHFRVLGIAGEDAEIVSRLYALGVFPGASLHLLRRAPLGDPLQVKVGHTLLSIRKNEAEVILVEASALPFADSLHAEVA